MTLDRIRTVKQFAQEFPIFTESSLRWIIFNRANNGLDQYNAILKVNGRVLINVDEFEKWIKSHGEIHPSHR